MNYSLYLDNPCVRSFRLAGTDVILPEISRKELLPNVEDPNEILPTMLVFNVSANINSTFNNFDTSIVSFKFRKFENSLYEDIYINENPSSFEINVENLSKDIVLQIPRVPKQAPFD